MKIIAMMLLGMALFKSGILLNNRSPLFYQQMFIWGLAVGLPLTIAGLVWNYLNQWQIESYFALGFAPNLLVSTAITMAYLSLALLWLNSNIGKKIKQGLIDTGRMALSNYIMQSIICVTLFYGYGFALYGGLNRLQLAGIVAAMILGQWQLSRLWLAKFQQGPMEWLVRRLAYSKQTNVE